MAKGTSSIRESVCASSKVLPVPVGPISKYWTCSVRYRPAACSGKSSCSGCTRHREFLFRAVLPDDVTIQKLLISGGRGSRLRRRGRLFALLVFQNGLANSHALIADVRARVVRRRTDQLLTCSCVLWQKEQRSGSSGFEFFSTGMKASSPLGFDGVPSHYSRADYSPEQKRKSMSC